MINDIEVLNDIKEIIKKTELLANPLYNDFCGSHIWGDINERLKQIKKDLENNFKTFNINY